MQTENPCDQYLNSTEVIRIVQSNNETFINQVLTCIRDSREEICRNVLTKHYLVADDMLQLCREDAFQEAQLLLIQAIRNNRFIATTETCIPYLKKLFRNLYWHQYQQEIKRKLTTTQIDRPAIENVNKNEPDDNTEKVHKLLAQLGSTDREIYRLHYLEGLKVSAIAPLLKIDARSVTKQLIRLHQRFSGLWHQLK